MEPVWPREGTAQALVSTSNISISELFENVNPEDKNFLKYVPERFLKDNQRVAKTDSMEAESKRIGNYFEKQGEKKVDLQGDTNAVYEKLTALIKQDRADRYGWKNGEDTTKSDPLFDEIVANLHINDDSSLIGTQQNFVGTAALQKAGIKIDGSVGDYSIDLKGKAKIAKEYKAMNREIRNYKKRMKMTEQEMQAAKDFYEDQISDEELKKLDGIRHKVVRGYVDLLIKRQGLDKPNGRVLFARDVYRLEYFLDRIIKDLVTPIFFEKQNRVLTIAKFAV
ncbi:MAG: hypothetical protein IJN80_02475 [Clostridia bacterium]|nr:hypothetical protein [Clostridia bacterium]